MSPESQIIIKASSEFNAAALAERYDLMRQQVALMGGQIVVGAEARAQHEAKQQDVQEALKQREYARNTYLFVTKAAQMLIPDLRDPIPNKRQNYFKVLGLADRVVWKENVPGMPTYPSLVIGANPKKGLVISHGGYSIDVIDGRKAKKLARHYSNIMQDVDPTILDELYNPESDSFIFTSEHRSAKFVDMRNAREYEDSFPEAYLHEYGVTSHLMHLSALFGKQKEWGDLLNRYTKDASESEVSQVKHILEAHFPLQPESPQA